MKHRGKFKNRGARPLEERFWEKVDKRGPTECWRWLGGRSSDGYGSIVAFGKVEGSHRVSYFLETKEWPLKHQHVCHRCDNPPCVNPAHLFLGNYKINNTDKKQKGRAYSPPGELNHRASLTNKQADQIRREYLSLPHAKNGKRIGVKQLAERYNVTSHVVCMLGGGHTYRQTS